MPDGPVVANNTPLVALWSLGKLDLLRDLFGQVLIPQAVESEFLAFDRVSRQDALTHTPWIEVVAVTEQRRALAYLGLDEGESEVLALAEERDAQLILMDERKGRRYAQRMGFAVTGTLGLLLLAKEEGLVQSVRALVRELQESGLYLSPALVARAIELAGE
jgi:predicted nucleic acid-binding protein